MNAMPPDPAFRGDPWRDDWLARLEATPPWLFAWLRQQHDGPYWRPGSLAPDYDAIEAAILNIGGWMDCVRGCRRCGCRPAARRRRGRSSATGSMACRSVADAGPEPRRAARDRPLLRPTGCRASRQRRGRGAADRLVRARVRATRSRSRRVSRAAGGPRPPIRIRTTTPSAGASRGGSLPLVGRARSMPSGPTPDRRRPARTSSSTGRPSAPAARCRGAPAARRTASPATSAPTRMLGPTYTSDAAAMTRSRSSASRRSSSTSRSTRRSRRRRPADRCRAGRHRRPGQRRGPQPDPPALPRRTRSRCSPVSSRRSGSPLRTGRLSVPARPSHPRRRSRRRCGRSSGRRRTRRRFELHRGPGDAVAPGAAGRPARRRSGRRARARVQDRATGPALASAEPLDGGRAAPISRSGGSTTDVIAGTVTVTIHDGGEDVLDDGRRLYAAETLADGRATPIPRTRRARRRCRLSLAGARLRDGDPRPLESQTQRRRRFDLAVELEVDVDGEPFFRRTWRESIARRLV